MAKANHNDAAAVIYEEALVLYEIAKADFEALTLSITARLRAGRALTNPEVVIEEEARSKLLHAIERLDIRKGGALDGDS